MKNYQELPKLRDSISYLYIEHAVIEQNDTAIIAIQKEGKTPIPIAAMTCLLLGPGTRITHAAIRAICDNGCMLGGFMPRGWVRPEAPKICCGKQRRVWRKRNI